MVLIRLPGPFCMSADFNYAPMPSISSLSSLLSQVIWFNAFMRASFEAEQTGPGFDLQYKKKRAMIYQDRKYQ